MMMTTTSKEEEVENKSDISPEETNGETSKQQPQQQQLPQQQQQQQQPQVQQQFNHEDLFQVAKPRPNPPPKRLSQPTNPDSDNLVRMIFSEQRLQVSISTMFYVQILHL